MRPRTVIAAPATERRPIRWPAETHAEGQREHEAESLQCLHEGKTAIT